MDDRKQHNDIKITKTLVRVTRSRKVEKEERTRKRVYN